MLPENFREVLLQFKPKGITCFDLRRIESSNAWLSQIIKVEPSLDMLYSKWKAYPFDVKPKELISLNAYIRKHFYNILSLFYIFKANLKFYIFAYAFDLEIKGNNVLKRYDIDFNRKIISFTVVNLSDVFELILELAKAHIKEKITIFAKSRGLRNKITLHIIKRGHIALGYCKYKRPYNELAFKWQVLLIEEIHQEVLLSHELAHLKVRNHKKAFWQHHDFLLGKDSKLADMTMGSEMQRYIWLCNP